MQKNELKIARLSKIHRSTRKDVFIRGSEIPGALGKNFSATRGYVRLYRLSSVEEERGGVFSARYIHVFQEEAIPNTLFYKRSVDAKVKTIPIAIASLAAVPTTTPTHVAIPTFVARDTERSL